MHSGLFRLTVFFQWRSEVIHLAGKSFQKSYSTWNQLVHPLVTNGHSYYRNTKMTDFMELAGFKVYPWSVSGLETAIVVHKDKLKVCFDLGYAHAAAVDCEYVFISHGHVDHVAGIAHHAAKRELFGLRPATYYVPPSLVDPLRQICALYAVTSQRETLMNVNILAMNDGDVIKLPNNRVMRCFPTVHRVKSQGYILYKHKYKLLPEYENATDDEIKRAIQEGKTVKELVETPEIAYTGDTRFNIFLNPQYPDILRVKLLILEATFIEADRDLVERARQYGHTHFLEIIGSAEIFGQVEALLLFHLSNKYSPEQAERIIRPQLPPSLAEKVHIAVLAKSKMI